MTAIESQIELFPIADILISPRSREVDQDHAKALAGMIAKDGLLHPITLRKTLQGTFLVAGAHRLSAHKLNGETHIKAMFCDATNDAEAKEVEVLENLGQAALTAFDHAKHLADWKHLYEKQNPEAKHGARRGPNEQANKEPILGFSKYASSLTGASTTKIKRAVTIWNGLSKEAKIDLEGTKYATRKADLEAISKESHTVQLKILKLLFPLDKNQKAIGSVKDALDVINNGHVQSSVTKKLQSFHNTMRDMPDKIFDLEMRHHKDRVLAWADKIRSEHDG